MADNPYQQPQQPTARRHHDDNRVVLSDVDIPFGRMVLIILKWMLASIPAMIILWIFMAIIAMIFGGMLSIGR